ncbi:glycosyltransferase family 1 protein [Hebeloma cylindrosporum]|uniref:Glycosyltransferase family 1 protein n=1 Tax=Hebeloma cylindrosporum TaxID=76867 RepID=A0A0C3CF79_HEBCY|nr:glycosyltransferase family 1 protein [Hebeloma cylindrosporum h7]
MPCLVNTHSEPHLLLVPLYAFGHIRPLCALAARLLMEKENVILTFFAPPHQLEQVRKDISNQFPKSLISTDVKGNALKRIRVVTTFKSADDNIVNLFMPFFQSYPAAYETLYHGRPFTCATTGEVFDAVPPPVAVIMDVFALPQFQATRALSGKSVPIIALLPGPSSSFIRAFGPESLGGMGDFEKRVDAEAERLGVSPDEIRDKVFKHTEGKILKIGGLPEMYDYELYPQQLPNDSSGIASVLRSGAKYIFNECDGVLITSSHSYEGSSLIHMKSWFKSMPQEPLPVYAVGPLLPPGYGRIQSTENSESEKSRDVQIFLKEMQAKHGERSVIFISFGTVYWPTVPEYLDEVLQALIEKEVPFILCHASPFFKLPEEMANNVKSSGLGFLTTWAPQQDIFSHPATGWFLTHGGNGGVTEALGCGIPMICWPFVTDQPTTSIHLSCDLKVAFELMEVRTGPDGLKPLLRNGVAAKGTREAVGKEIREVIDACRGERGEELRRNAKGFKEKFAKAWEDGGEAKLELKAFLERYV